MDNYQGRNLFVKNIHETVDSERLRQEFSRFGEITSARVMYDGNGHKGFGFVCFSKTEEAARALRDMNRTILVSKPIYVNLHYKWEDRRAYLASQREIRRSKEQPMDMRMPPIMPQFVPMSMPSSIPPFMPPMPQPYFLQPVWPAHPVMGGAPPPTEENLASRNAPGPRGGNQVERNAPIPRGGIMA